MSMTTTVIGFRPPDETWKKMKTVWDSCEKAGIDIPDEVFDFFNATDIDPNGIQVELPTREWRNEGEEGYEIDVKDIPKNVTIIRFSNSW